MKEIVTGGVLPMMTHLMDDARETIRLKDDRITALTKVLTSVSSIQVDWHTGVVSAQEAMIQISEVLHKADGGR